MTAIRNLLLAYKHDIMAGFFAATSMIFVLHVAVGRGGASGGMAPPAKGFPLSFGASREKSDAPDALARGGETTQRAKAEPPYREPATIPTVDQSLQYDEQNQDSDIETESQKQKSDPRTDNSKPEDPKVADQKQEDSDNFTSKQVAVNAADVKPDQNGALSAMSEPTADKKSAIRETTAAPNAVEAAPKPVADMSAEELEKAVESYDQWVREGQINLWLDYSRLSTSQLDSITMFYVVRTKYSALFVTPDGTVEPFDAKRLPDGKLIGDLTRDRRKWPQMLMKRSRERFGQNYEAEANFLLTDDCAVLIYRTLAEAVGNREPGPKTRFDLRLEPLENQIEVTLIRNDEER